jgi:hypothetical protein
MSHCTVQCVKPPAKTGTPATARTPSTEGKPITSYSKGTTPKTPETSAIAGRTATGNHQELKRRQQKQE